MSSQPMPGKLSSDLVNALRTVKAARFFPKGTALFQPGATVLGLYLVDSGEVRVLLPTGPGQRQLLQVVGPGSPLGLSECMNGGKYRIAAEAGDDATVSFVRREEFLGFLREHCNFSVEVARLLSEDLHGIYHKFRSISAHPGRPRHRPLDELLN